MKASDIPAKIVLPFGASAGGSYIRTVPVSSQIGVQDGAASYTDGFPPLNFVDPALGGVPPFGQDMNGLLNAISAMTRWFNSGAPVPYDAALSTAIGGYPKGAIVQSATTFGNIWVCLVDDNTSNPDTGGANWESLIIFLGIAGAYAPVVFNSSGTFVATKTTHYLSGSGGGGGGGATLTNNGVAGSATTFVDPTGPTTLLSLAGGGGGGCGAGVTATGGIAGAKGADGGSGQMESGGTGGLGGAGGYGYSGAAAAGHDAHANSGGGGGGAGASNTGITSSAGGGGSGEICREVAVSGLTIGHSYTVTIGGGGAGGAAGGGGSMAGGAGGSGYLIVK